MAIDVHLVLLVPNTRWFGKRCWMWFTPAVPYLTAVLNRRRVPFSVLEANIDDLTPEAVAVRLAELAPDAVAIPCMSLEYWRQAHEAARLAKEAGPDIVTILGGAHPTSLPERVMEDPNVDYLVLGEGEERLPDLLAALQKDAGDLAALDGIAYRDGDRVVVRPPQRWIEDLDALPLPDYTAFDAARVMNHLQHGAAGGMCTKRTPVGAVMTSRGCPYGCCFCAGHVTMGRRTRFRSPESVLREVDMLVRDFGIRELVFQDDNMYARRERALAIVDGIRARGYDLLWKNSNLAAWHMDRELMRRMKESGCYQVTISPESGSPRVLKEIIHKPGTREDALNVSAWCKEFDLELEADFVIGFPGETWDDIRQTTNFAEELDADAVKFAVATPFPGTELFETAVRGGYLPADFDFYRDDALGFANPVIETEEFSATELRMIRCLEWDRINFRTKAKADRYRRVNPMTEEELAQFRRDTRRNLGVYFME